MKEQDFQKLIVYPKGIAGRLMDGIRMTNYNVVPFLPGKEWIVLVDGERVGTVRQESNLYGWRDRYGGHWFPSFDVAAERRVNR